MRKHAVELTVKPAGPTAFDVEWKTLSDVISDGGTRFLVTHSSQFADDIEFFDNNNATLTGLNECASYVITVRRYRGHDKNNVTFGPPSSAIAFTSHNSREYKTILRVSTRPNNLTLT